MDSVVQFVTEMLRDIAQLKDTLMAAKYAIKDKTARCIIDGALFELVAVNTSLLDVEASWAAENENMVQFDLSCARRHLGHVKCLLNDALNQHDGTMHTYPMAIYTDADGTVQEVFFFSKR